MTVWVVLYDAYDGDSYTIVAMFDSEEKAKRYVDKTRCSTYTRLSYESWNVK